MLHISICYVFNVSRKRWLFGKKHLLANLDVGMPTSYENPRSVFSVSVDIDVDIDSIRQLSHEKLISQLMNSNDYQVNLRLIMFISSCLEMRDKLIWPLLEYWIDVMIVEIVSW